MNQTNVECFDQKQPPVRGDFSAYRGICYHTEKRMYQQKAEDMIRPILEKVFSDVSCLVVYCLGVTPVVLVGTITTACMPISLYARTASCEA